MKTDKLILTSLALAVWLTAFTLPASPALDLARQLNQAFIEVAEKVSPSVVVIDVTQKASAPAFDEEGSPWDALPPGLRRRFRQQFEQLPPEEKTHGQGSGVIIRADGYILTNRHVVEDAEKIEVHLQDGRHFIAQVRGEDPQSDVAVLKIDAKGLPVAKLADSAQTRVGEFAIAIGAPFALDYSVTFGHVSAKGRSGVIRDDPLMDQEFIQTDANINPGNSGGPLVNIDGEVIGINTLIRGLHTGIGFAIPSNLAREVADKLIADGKFTRAWLGIGIESLREDPELQELFPGVSDGVVIQRVEPDGPAAKSELRPADVITTVDGVSVSTAQQLKDEVRRKTIGQLVTLDVIRKGKPVKIKVQTAERETDNSPPETRPVVARPEDTTTLGFTVQMLTHELADEFQTAMVPGVIVTAVERGSIADRSQIRPGDIITGVGQKPVTSTREFRAAIKAADLNKGVILNLLSGKISRFEVLKADDE